MKFIVKKAIILARVSKDDQLDGFSIPAQLARSQEYAKRKNLDVLSEHQFDESSTKDKRHKFEEVIKEIKKAKEPVALIVETVDRLQRSFRESVMLDELRKSGKLEIHFIRENLVVHKDSNSSEIQRWDLAVFVAKSYVLQLSDNVKRSYQQKVREGELYGGKAPVGYAKEEVNGKSTVVLDRERDFLIRKVFELYATGKYSMKKLTKEMKKRGLTNNSGTRKPLATSQIERILKNPFYYGMMRFKEELYPHKYEPIVSRNLFDKVQKVIQGYNRQNFKRNNKPYVFRGMIKCARCGCAISPELHKGHVYYHCTDFHEEHSEGKVEWIREEELIRQIRAPLESLRLPPEAVERLKGELRTIYDNEQVYYEKNLKVITDRIATLDRITKIMYDDRLVGRITTDEYDKRVIEYDKEKQDLIEQMGEHSSGNKEFLITINKVLDLATRAADIFESSEVEEKTQLLNFLFQNLTLDGEKLLFELKIPFKGIVAYSKNGNQLGVWDEVRNYLISFQY